MSGLLLKDFYTLRQYTKTMLIMLFLFALISFGLDNPATFFEGFIIIMSMMMSITSFSYDSLAKWDRFGLSLPITRKEVVAGKYILSLLLCLIGAVLAFLISSMILILKPVEDFGMMEHILSLLGIVSVVLLFFSLILPLIFKFGVEKSRLVLVGVFAIPTAGMIALGQLGVASPSESTLTHILKGMPLVVIFAYILSYFLSVKIYTAKEI